MFDQLTSPPAPPSAPASKPAGTPPANLPVADAPEDIFAGVKEPTLSPTEPAVAVPPIGEQAARGGLKKILTISGAAVVVVIIGAVSWLTFFRGGEEELVSETVLNQPAPPTEVEPETPSANAAAPSEPVLNQPAPPAEADRDFDGLLDVKEEELGTDMLAADTDNDGLSDGDEVRVYKTDPKNPDTDGDTFQDGSEVRNGYDPNAKGKRLFEIPPATP